MSVRLIADVLEGVHDLTSGQKLLLICLANYANDKGECWPSIASLAAQADVSTRHVSGMLHDLEKLGYLTIQEHSGKSNSYTLHLARPTNHSSGVRQDSGVIHSSGDPRTTGHPPTNHSSWVPTNCGSSKPSYRTVKEPSSEPSGEARAKRAHRIPADFAVTDDLRAWGYKKSLTDADMDRATERFVNYWQGSGKSKSDWPATWRSWMLREIDDGRLGPRPAPNGRASPGRVSNYDQSAANIMGDANDYGASGPVFETTGRIAG